VRPYYNGGEKRIFETKLNVNSFFERVAQRVLTTAAYDFRELTKVE
jgi:Rad3-related DNA helicase